MNSFARMKVWRMEGVIHENNVTKDCQLFPYISVVLPAAIGAEDGG
jgi:hypothetical protein